MAIKDEIRRERKKFLETATFNEKVNYFFQYYTLHTIVIIFVVVCLSVFIYNYVTAPDVILNGIFLNTYNYENTVSSTELGKNFLKDQNINSSKYDVSFSMNLVYEENDTTGSSYETSDALLVQSAAGALDFIAGPLNDMENLAYGGVFVDLSEVLSVEELALYEPYLLYIDREVVMQLDEASANFENLSSITLPDSSKPEEMTDPIPVFIDMSHCKKMTDVYGYSISSLVFSISIQAPNPETLSDFIAYVME